MMLTTVLLCLVLFWVIGVWSSGYWLQPGYLKRWHVIPRNMRFNVYLHKICKGDMMDWPHDHPWDFYSILFKGSYTEREYMFIEKGLSKDDFKVCVGDEWILGYDCYGTNDTTYAAPDFVKRVSGTTHKVLWVNGGPAWTLVFTGRNLRNWGFYCRDEYSPENWDRVREGEIGVERDMWIKIPACDFFEDRGAYKT